MKIVELLGISLFTQYSRRHKNSVAQCPTRFPAFDIFQVNDSFTTVYSGGRDRHVWATDLRNPEIRTLVCIEQAPITKASVLKIFCNLLLFFLNQFNFAMFICKHLMVICCFNQSVQNELFASFNGTGVIVRGAWLVALRRLRYIVIG